jgi:hypothetical protein
VAESVWSGVAAVVLALWLVATIVHQFSPAWWQRVFPSDAVGLLPHWNFFAPLPAREDTHIVYRDMRDDLWGGWQALTLGAGDRRWRWVWNPVRLPSKAASDLANGLRRSAKKLEGAPRAIILSNSYVCLLQWASAQPREPGVTHRQFALVTSRGFGGGKAFDLLFVSEAHRLDP